MTLAELLALADAATPGPWRVDSVNETIYCYTGDSEYGNPIVADVIWPPDIEQGEQNARLIALAPDLARLVAEMGEALVELRKWAASEWPEQKDAIYRADDALAKLSELEMRP